MKSALSMERAGVPNKRVLLEGARVAWIGAGDCACEVWKLPCIRSSVWLRMGCCWSCAEACVMLPLTFIATVSWVASRSLVDALCLGKNWIGNSKKSYFVSSSCWMLHGQLLQRITLRMDYLSSSNFYSGVSWLDGQGCSQVMRQFFEDRWDK